jgi:hypothetical protein
MEVVGTDALRRHLIHQQEETETRDDDVGRVRYKEYSSLFWLHAGGALYCFIMYILLVMSMDSIPTNDFNPEIVIMTAMAYLTSVFIGLAAIDVIKLDNLTYDGSMSLLYASIGVAAPGWLGALIAQILYQKWYSKVTPTKVLILLWLLTVVLAIAAVAGVMGYAGFFIILLKDPKVLDYLNRDSANLHQRVDLALKSLANVEKKPHCLRECIKQYMRIDNSGYPFRAVDRLFLLASFKSTHFEAWRILRRKIRDVSDPDTPKTHDRYEIAHLQQRKAVVDNVEQIAIIARNARDRMKLVQDRDLLELERATLCLEEQSGVRCHICMQRYKRCDTVVQLPECLHFLHHNCMQMHLSFNVRCHTCEQSIKHNLRHFLQHFLN